MKTNTKKIIELENQVKLLRAEMEKVQKHLGLPAFEEIIQRGIEFLDAELVRRGSGKPFREAMKTSYEEQLKEYLEAPVSGFQDPPSLLKYTYCHTCNQRGCMCVRSI